MKERFFNLKKKLLQRFANFVVEKIKTSKNEQETNYWFNFGMNVNAWCVERNIWLD